MKICARPQLRGAHAPSRAPFGASPNGRAFDHGSVVLSPCDHIFGEAPKTAHEARALPGALAHPANPK